MKPDLVISGATAVTVDPDRRVIDDAWIAVSGDRIAAIGTGAAPAAANTIDGSGMVAMPGLIDAHSHAGHALVRAAGSGDGKAWFGVCEAIYSRLSTPGFWLAEQRLAQLERLKGGVTTAVSLLGGGADIYRTDDEEAGDAHCQATVESGLRTIMAAGVGRPPFPKRYARQMPDGTSREFDLTWQRQLEVSEALIKRWNDVIDRRTGVCLVMPVFNAGELADPQIGREARQIGEAIMDLRSRADVLFTQDGHRDGSIALARDCGLLGPFALLGHSVDLTPDDFVALTETGAAIVHNPSAIMSIYGRCPAPELIEAGVTVCIGSDAAAPDRGFDMFRHMAQCMHYHRRHFRDPDVLPPGKVLEMVTIDAARALGLDKDIGSLEPGKKADIVLVDTRKPHLYPPTMPVTKLAHFANAADVDSVIVDGKVLMQGRRTHLDEMAILDGAAREARLAFGHFHDPGLLTEPPDYWNTARRRARSVS